MSVGSRKTQIGLAVSTALSAVAIVAAPHAANAAEKVGSYVAGDFHNHTTCSDGSISMEKLVKKATDKQDTPWGLDWFVQAGHGGNGNRNCTLVEDDTLASPAYPVVLDQKGAVAGPNTTWQNSIPAVQPKGLANGTAPNQNMWRWQSLQEFQYPVIEYLSVLKSKPLFLGLESIVAGHEHSSMAVINGQVPARIFRQSLPTTPGYTALGNANALSNWEYCFDRADGDTSRGNTIVGGSEGNNWNCSVAGSLNSSDPSWSAQAQKLMPPNSGPGSGTLGHQKTVEAMRWMAQNAPQSSYYVPAHLERAGPFNPDGNNGYNIESLRDFNNVAPMIAFGFETQPGHGASDARGEYTIRRNPIGTKRFDSVGGTTYGGTGVYGAQIGGVWDALLGEGRGFWFFASSDWHHRGIFGSDDRRSSQDFYPGEYQRTYVLVNQKINNNKPTPDLLEPQEIVDGLRTGNAFAASGQLIDRMAFVACEDTILPNALGDLLLQQKAILAAVNNQIVDVPGGKCATMGEKLKVHKGQGIVVAIAVRDPVGTNYSPYTFPNPSLLQDNISQPINQPVLDHIDVIRGEVSGYKTPGSADYSGAWPDNWVNESDPTAPGDLTQVPAAAKNTTAKLFKTFNSYNWRDAGPANATKGIKVMTFRIPALKVSQYLRLRGTNLPAGTPWETDANGNPLSDLVTNNAAVNKSSTVATDPDDSFPASTFLKIPCTTVGSHVPANDGAPYTGANIDGCPNHLPVVNGQKMVAYDVAAWSDLWFYSNPIYVEVQGSVKVAGVK